MTRLDAAALALWKNLKASTGVVVTVTRDGETPIEIYAVPGRSDHEEYDADGNTMTSREDDWIVLASDYAIGGSPVVPEQRDEITRTGISTVWKVLKRGGDRCYAPVDQTGLILRIHTKRTTS